MATDAEIEAAVRSMRAIRTSGGKVHDEVLRAYARAALEAAELAQVAEYWRRAELRANAAIQAAADQRGAGLMAS
jgi:beta-xylosidase